MENNFQIPRTIKIGVVCPHKVNNLSSIGEKVKNILSKIDNKLTKTPYFFVAISSLSEGTDQIFTNEIINFKGSNNLVKSSLEVILKNDLNKNAENNDDFLKLIDSSVSTKTMGDVLSEDIYKNVAEEYTHVGQVIVDKCDFLIAVDDEEYNDTNYIIEYARHHAKPIFIINTNDKSINEINTDFYFKSLEYHDIYNNEKINLNELEKAKNDSQYLIGKMDALNLNSEQKKLIEENIFNQFLRADLLAMNYQSKHYLSVNLVYYFSAAAIAIVILEVFFLQFSPLLIIEALMMFIIIVLLFRNRKKDWHRKWIDYRYLAERLRAAMIFSMVGLECKVLDNLPYQRVSGDWVLNAYESIYEKQLAISHPNLDLGEIKKFVLDQWINDQMEFYHKKSIIHFKKDKMLNILIYLAFTGALIGAILHALTAISKAFEIFAISNIMSVFEIPDVSHIITFVVVVFPAVAASIAGIRVQHEYLRISKRYSHMESYLKSIEYKIKKLKNNDKEKLIELLEKANNVMLREHQDWRVIFSSREPELP